MSVRYVNVTKKQGKKGETNRTAVRPQKNCNFKDFFVLIVAKGQRNELCFKTSYRNCECKCVNVKSDRVRWCLELFQSGQLEKKIFYSVHISSRKYDDLQSLLNNKPQPHCIQVFVVD